MRGFRFGFKQNLYAVLGENFLHFLRDVGVFVVQQLLTDVDHSHLAAEAAEHLPELQADVPAAKNHQVLGHRVQFHDRFVGQEGDIGEAIDLRHRGPQAGIEEEPAGLEGACAAGTEVDVDGFGSDEVREAVDQLDILRGLQALFVPRAGILDDFAFAFANFGQVDGNGAGGN